MKEATKIFLQNSTLRGQSKSKMKNYILKYKYNTILGVTNLQKTGLSFDQAPVASDT